MPKLNKRLSLNGKWNVHSVFNALLQKNDNYTELAFNAIVPGSTLNDLVNAGITCSDIFWRDNAETVQKYENYNWRYTKVFTVEQLPEGRAILVFERLDTYCDVYLNGTHLGFFDNGYIEHKIDVTGHLISGENLVEVMFYSPINYTLGKEKLPTYFTSERIYNRRIQCTYGWDWTMRFVTTGIYGDCYIEYQENRPCVEDVYIYTKNVDEESASVGIDCDLSKDSVAGVLKFSVVSPSGETVCEYRRFCKEKFFRITLDIPSPELWYPLGYGAQPLYTLIVSYEDADIFTEKFGIRTVKVMRLPDKRGSENYQKCLELKKTDFSKEYDFNEEFSGFILKVNGVKILCKGANWVPCAPFEMGGMEDKITRILTLSADAGVNMIRVWGGGYVEKRHFYNECSRLGILVIHDFFMACGTYPEKEEWFISQLNKEADFLVRYLRNQPCLAWWQGDNENAVNGSDIDDDYIGRDSAYLGLAPYVWKLDPYREFLPSSPYGGRKNASSTVGTTHNTQFLSEMFHYFNEAVLDDYKEYIGTMNARFISEDPIFGAASLAALHKMMSEDDILGDNLNMWKYHTRSNPALKIHLFDQFAVLAEKVLGSFENGEDRLFKLQYIQCEMVRLSLERVRREKWFSSGDLFWMLSDCWPAACGWSLIDYYAAPKPAFYAFKRVAASIIPILREKDGKIVLTVSNDKTEDVKVRCRITEITGSSPVNQSEWVEYTISANKSEAVASFAASNDKSLLIADVEYEGNSSRTFYKKGALRIQKANDCDFIAEFSDNSVIITANTYIQAIGIECNDTDTLLSDNYFTMLPGESKTIRFSASYSPNAQIVAYKLVME